MAAVFFKWNKDATDYGCIYKLRIFADREKVERAFSNAFTLQCARAFTRQTPRHLVAQELRAWHRKLWSEARKEIRHRAGYQSGWMPAQQQSSHCTEPRKP